MNTTFDIGHILTIISLTGVIYGFFRQIHKENKDRVDKVAEKTRDNFETVFSKIEVNKIKLDNMEIHINEKLDNVEEDIKDMDKHFETLNNEVIKLTTEHRKNHL